MPSGSGGGSHFSSGGGGGSFGGGSHGSHSRGSGSDYRPRSRVIIAPGFFHTSYVYYDRNGNPASTMPRTRAMTVLSVLSILFVLAFIAFFGVMIGMSAYNGDKPTNSEIEQDYEIYHQMVENAEYYPEYQITGTITAINKKYDKYYIEYSFTRPSFGDPNNPSLSYNYYHGTGWTYSIYTEEDLVKYGYEKGGDIDLATNYNMKQYILSGEVVDSVPMDFIDFSPEDDAEWGGTLDAGPIFGLLFSFIILIVAAMLITNVIVKKQIHEYELQHAGDGINQTTDASQQGTVSGTEQTPITPNSVAKKIRKCRYCGSTLPDGVNSCPNCGASGDIDE